VHLRVADHGVQVAVQVQIPERGGGVRADVHLERVRIDVQESGRRRGADIDPGERIFRPVEIHVAREGGRGPVSHR
jgi:hypothetical protein